MTSVTRVVPLEDGAGVGRPRLRLVPSVPGASTGAVNDPLVGWRSVAKRTVDLVVATVALFLTLPVILLAAMAIKLQDGGPVLFRQQRVGKDGKRFMMYKLRTMVPDAEHQLPRLRPHNHRDGPLFKLSNDPRVTRVGRLLRATSVDELPQLVAVLQGTMSMVGPRPALPEEVAQFDESLLGRLAVSPGLTGLWQVEARDDPSFASYRRFDLCYIENWSLRLDFAIMVSTVIGLPRRSVQALRQSDAAVLEPVIALD